MVTDLCKLCKINVADKRNSHIVSQFLTKAILGSEGPRNGHTLDTSKPFDKPKISQDSPKQHHILCTECEKYFEILETYISERTVKRYGDPKYADNFILYDNGHGVFFCTAEKISPLIMKLFVYSLFWRCSVSQLPLFENFTLKLTEEELLRDFLVKCKTQSIKDMPEDIIKDDFPYVVLRPEQKDPEPTKNFLYANNGNEDIYQIIANEYIFMLAFEIKGSMATFDILINIKGDKVKLGLLKMSTWDNLRQGLYNHAASIALKNANKSNQL